MAICSECYRMVGENEFTIIDGKFVCKHCYVHCANCDEAVLLSECEITVDGYVCSSCADNYDTCAHCGKKHHVDNMTWVDDQYVCEDCLSNFYVNCDDCGELIHRDNAYYVYRHGNEQQVCYECRYDHYNECHQCGDVVHEDDSEWDEESEYCYCYSCWEDIKNKVIFGYHGFDDFSLKSVASDTTSYGYGFELEVAGYESHASDFLSFFDDNNEELVLMHDGSVNGFEIVTQPMTEGYFYEVFKPKFEKGLKFLREAGFKGHNAGGLHIHVSKEMISTGMLAQLGEILYSENTDDYNTWLRLTQRKNSAMSSWCSMLNRDNTFEEILDEGYSFICDDRYTALNYDRRTSTYEFRIFNSNIRFERFMKNFECVKALLDYTKEHEDDTEPTCDTQGFLEYVEKKSLFYPNLYAFMEEMNIKSKYGTVATEQELEVA